MGLKEGMEHILDDKEILGLKGANKLAIIVRIQALFRGSIARREIKKIYGFQATPGMNQISGSGEANYQNPTVMEIKRQLGPFNY